MRSLKICHASPEIAPLAKVGGLADVAAALPAALKARGHDVLVVVPYYPRIRESGLSVEPLRQGVPLRFGNRVLEFDLLGSELPEGGARVGFVHCPSVYGTPSIYDDASAAWRALVLSRAAIESCQHLQWSPDIFHVHDWTVGAVPLLLRTRYAWDRLFAGTRTVLTIHNLAHQGWMSAGAWEELQLPETKPGLPGDDLEQDRISLLKLGLLHADALTTVSPTYAREIQTPEHGFGLDAVLRSRRQDLYGILNGIDEAEWNPLTDTHLDYRYSVKSLWRKEKNKEALLRDLGLPHEPDVPAIGMVSRLNTQKGLDLVEEVLPGLLETRDLRFVVLGTGETRFEDFFENLQRRFPEKVCFYRGFHNELAHKIEGGCDLFLMPSWFEPCGLNQLYSLAYGTIPVVRATGGLADTVRTFRSATGTGNGVVFDHYDAAGLRWALEYALSIYENPVLRKEVQRNGMAEDHSWARGAEAYEEIYRRLVGSLAPVGAETAS